MCVCVCVYVCVCACVCIFVYTCAYMCVRMNRRSERAIYQINFSSRPNSTHLDINKCIYKCVCVCVCVTPTSAYLCVWASKRIHAHTHMCVNTHLRTHPTTEHLLQYVAVHCSLLQCVAVWIIFHKHTWYSDNKKALVCCSMLQCVQCVAVSTCCYCVSQPNVRVWVLHMWYKCVAVCCSVSSVLQCLRVAIAAVNNTKSPYRVAKTHRMPYLYKSFSAKEPYI